MYDFAVCFLGDGSSFIVTRNYDDISVSVAKFREHTDKIGVFKNHRVPLRKQVVSSVLVLRANDGTCD